MTWLQSLRGESRANLESPAVPLTSQSLVDMLVGPTTDAGVRVSEKSALGLPAVYRSIALIAGTCGGLPLHTYRDRGESRERVSPTPPIIAQPHPDLTPFEWAELAFVHALGWGNAFLRILRDENDRPRELWPIEPARVKVGRLKTGEKVYGIDTGDLSGRDPGELVALDKMLPLTDREVLHIPGLGYDGILGLSPIAAARQALSTAMASEKYAARLYGSGTLLSGVLSTEQKLDQAQAEALKQRWKAANSGIDKAHDIAVLGSNTKFQPISMSPADAQWIEAQRFGVAQVARIFGVPPHMLMDTERSTSWGTGIEQQSIGFVTYTLRPWLIRFEQRLSRLVPKSQYVKFSVEGLLRGDTAQRAAFYKQMWDIGVFSTNEIRQLEDRPPIEGGDMRYRPLNMGQLGQADPIEAPADELEGGQVDA